MKHCRKCGCEIVNGMNGCQLLGDICFDCNGGRPKYPDPIVIAGPIYEDVDFEELILIDQEANDND